MLIWSVVILAVVLFYAGITVHELGHAYGCRRSNVPVKEIAVLGWKLPRVPELVLPIRSKSFPETRWVVHPFIVGAYMQPDEERMKSITRRERVAILAAGPVASCLYGFALLTTAGLFAVFTPSVDDPLDQTTSSISIEYLFAAFASLAAFAVTYLLRWRTRFHFLLLGIGILLAPLLLYVFGQMLAEAFSGAKPFSEVFPGPLGLVRLVRDSVRDAIGADAAWARAVAVGAAWAGGLSVFVGLANMAPLLAGDGTMIVMEYLPERAARRLYQATVVVVVTLLAIGIVGDLLWLWEWARAPGP